MRRYKKILFVCEDNTAASLMAEMICKSMVTDKDVTITSRGMVVLFPEPINPKVQVVLINHGLELEERTAKMLDNEDLDETTLVLTMTMHQKERIIRDFDFRGSVHTMYGFIGEEMDMMDPYGGSVVEYEDCFATMSRVIKKIVIKLKKMYGLQDTERYVE
ncbi:MAG: phosphotyrosine protein phosphatase [Lachnospiraceae bacterium]|jgi:protein-tyrosine phosphatase|nr:phosphotyrosine protein phosphatase [Lachnospiraceae bacterium]